MCREMLEVQQRVIGTLVPRNGENRPMLKATCLTLGHNRHTEKTHHLLELSDKTALAVVNCIHSGTPVS